jgi:membrane-bound metal-dependent hydrolase YbcI (DUF457 family)
MPFTPYHLGPSAGIGILFLKIFDITTLLIASIIIDIEPFLILLFNLNYPIHGFFHSFLGGGIAALITAIVFYLLRDRVKKITALLKLTQDSTFLKIIWTALFGVYLHIILDSFLYSDIKPFYPSTYNPFYGLFSAQQIYSFCSWSFLAAILIYLFKKYAKIRN